MEVGRKGFCPLNFSDDDISAFYTGYVKLDELSDVLCGFGACGDKHNIKIEVQDETGEVVETISLEDISRALTVFECLANYAAVNFKLNVVFENEGNEVEEENK